MTKPTPGASLPGIGNPMDSDATDAGIRIELARVLAIVEVVNEKPDHHAEPDSDLAADETRFPDIWTATVARRGIVYAAENIEAACLLMLNGDWTAPQYALLRAAYESAGAATWLLQPDDIDTRLARLLWQHRESWRYSTKAYDGTSLDHDGEERQRWTDKAATRLGIDLRAGRSGGFENLIEEIDDLPGQPESLLTAWRLCSGVSHGKTWALNEVTTEIGSFDIYEHGRISQRVPDRGLFLTDLSVARRAVQQARGWYRIRTTARPHSMSMRLELRDRDGNVVPEG
ncbi:hypothetical protein [Mycolicibacterium fortuitum]|uniref:Uncharacterized protein n=2 Tax=Mycolicibacterium fortuitum TaxID=1766 RepID=A0AAE5ADX4_MYCFO|nr:hypothetical protein [Mycolicibacterium fortuitum]MCV7143549.1 hypothetical protein [Mycolicibacterium fortuitum]MDV7193205.1 hypothetical protein [Mycolicibacterium fortuitum]MDV7206509.1 hypothetical protein [Mycolicibacterium fortuitum]MDV7228036.1 hypothetical protein [Mycolicibacterium fortuitum]MDV7260318.1 hypothetical protein [Mycolicibacterium fortuitum]